MPKRLPHCRLGEHDYHPLRGGKFERCTKCSDVFPCRHECWHADCAYVKGVPVHPKTAPFIGKFVDFSREGLVPWKDRK